MQDVTNQFGIPSTYFMQYIPLLLERTQQPTSLLLICLVQLIFSILLQHHI